tara:strand:- start:1265 stop:1531 length:267 start_codon:yes stop_codon:yes gene_type:complete
MEEKQEEIKKEEPSILEQTNAALKKLEEQNALMAKNLSRAQEIAAELKLSGHASAGKPSQPTDEEKKDAAARKMLEGSGFEDELFPQK